MPRNRLIVCEQAHRWTVALRWILEPTKFDIVAVRQMTECWQRLVERPVSLIAWELDESNAADVLTGLPRLKRDFPSARAIVLLDRDAAHLEWLAREAGAVHACVSTRALEPIASIFARHQAAVPEAGSGFREAIWRRLPWDA
jgi:hypothetical protein